MSVLLATLCINELEWLPHLYEQHKDWPELASWVFVEAADASYAQSNPEMVSKDFLSVDGTSQFLRSLEAKDPRVTYIPHGLSVDPNPAKCKCQARQRYLDVAEQVKPELVVVLDADEFYTYRDQQRVLAWVRRHWRTPSFVFRKREIWRPPSLADRPLFESEVVGGFWKIDCCHWWRWSPGLNYRDCHNTPSNADGKPINDPQQFFADHPYSPQMIHLGYAAKKEVRLAKNRYYADRGEAVDLKRSWYVESRTAWENWKPGDPLPNGAEVIPYRGPVPEVFQAKEAKD